MKRLLSIILLISICLAPTYARKIKYPNGDVYKGKCKKGVPYGMGTMKYHTGETYVGMWAEGLRSGEGTYTIPSKNDTSSTTFSGTWLYDVFVEGTAKFPYGYYLGSFQGAKRFVFKTGRLTLNNGDFYDGDWTIDNSSPTNGCKLINGSCEVHNLNGSYYKGTIAGGEYDVGKLIVSPNEEYDGKWRNGAFISGNIRYITDSKKKIGVMKDGEMYEGIYVSDTTKDEYMNGRYQEYKFSGVKQMFLSPFGIVRAQIKDDEFARIEFNDTCYMEGDFGGTKSKLKNGSILSDLDGEYRKGTYSNWQFSGYVHLDEDKEGFSGYVNSGHYVNGKYNYGKNGYREGEWKGQTLYNGISNVVMDSCVEKGRYVDGIFYGELTTPKYQISNGTWVKDFEGTVRGDTIIGKMVYYGIDSARVSVPYVFEGTVISGMRQGVANFLSGSSQWKNDTLLYYKGSSLNSEWELEISLKGNEYYIKHILSEEFAFQNTCQYTSPSVLFNILSLNEKEYESEMAEQIALERQRKEEEERIRQETERKKQWEYVTTINVAIGYSITGRHVSYRYVAMNLYHKKGTSRDLSYDWYGGVTNYSIGENFSYFSSNSTYGQPIGWNNLSPQWGNSFRFYVWGVGYFDL